MKETYINGETQVRVCRRDNKDNDGEIHRGVVLQQTSHFLRVYNPAPVDKGGDVSPELSQMFPIQSPGCWCEIIGAQKRPMTIPPLFR